MKKINVIELFAGVGGFHVGFDRANKELNLKKNEGYNIIWGNQWEPSTKIQHAFNVYKNHFNKVINQYSNTDIHEVVENHFNKIPMHNLLVGGFPCQDYSVARTLTQAKGINGKKGVLWWDICGILNKFADKRPEYLMLENVDRLLKSPVKQRGRDFAIMLSSLAKLGYAVEWRVINAADYGMPQRRRRVYILGYKKGTDLYSKLKENKGIKWINEQGVFAKSFPIVHLINDIKPFKIDKDIIKINDDFNKDSRKTPFEISGVMIDREIYTSKIIPNYKGEQMTIKNILDKEKISEEFYIEKSSLSIWNKLKGAKKEKRKSKDGFEYNYSEGGMIFPDKLSEPSRTIVTGEGGSAPSRFKHVIEVNGKLRRLTPNELEALNMFPKGYTALEKSPVKRAFFMGNALVVGVITKLGIELFKEINS